MAGITTHVLDTVKGGPAAGVAIDLYRVVGDERIFLDSVVTNSDGRTDAPILSAEEVTVGIYLLEFSVGAYFNQRGTTNGRDPAFLDLVPIRFGLSQIETHYHVPLLVSPHAYSTYRGS